MKNQDILSFINPENFIDQSIGFEEIIEDAIGHEKDTFKQYMEFSKVVKNELARKAFIQLAHEELKHVEMLEQFQDSGYHFFAVPQADDKLNKAILKKASSVRLHPDIRLNELLLFAIHQENITHEYYREMAQQSNDKISHDTFVKLSRLEYSHAKRLEDIYTTNFARAS